MSEEVRYRYVLSPVDYEAMRKGYSPPSEHILIDQLQFRGARVICGSDMGETAYWLVMRGKPVRGKRALAIMKLIEDSLDAMADEETALAAEPPQDGPG